MSLLEVKEAGHFLVDQKRRWVLLPLNVSVFLQTCTYSTPAKATTSKNSYQHYYRNLMALEESRVAQSASVRCCDLSTVGLVSGIEATGCHGSTSHRFELAWCVADLNSEGPLKFQDSYSGLRFGSYAWHLWLNKRELR